MVKRNILSFIVALVILYLSLTGSDTFEGVSFFNIPWFDKIVHLGMYFGFMSVILIEHRQTLISRRSILLTSLIPFSYGIAMEILQALITTSRSASIFDVLFNSIGILFAIWAWILLNPFINRFLNRN